MSSNLLSGKLQLLGSLEHLEKGPKGHTLKGEDNTFIFPRLQEAMNYCLGTGDIDAYLRI